MTPRSLPDKQPQKVTNIVFYGVGGQGVLTASEICGWAALLEGHHVKKTEVHGMAQRGGSVESHLRFGEKVFSPLVPHGDADFLVCLNAEEHGRLKEMLRPKGIDLLPSLIKAQELVGIKKIYLNSVVLGSLACHLPFKESSWEKAFEIILSRKNFKENIEFFHRGKELEKRSPGLCNDH